MDVPLAEALGIGGWMEGSWRWKAVNRLFWNSARVVGAVADRLAGCARWGGRVSRSMCRSRPLTGGFRYLVLVCCIEWGTCSLCRRGDVSCWRSSEGGGLAPWLSGCYLCCVGVKLLVGDFVVDV